MQVVMGMYDQKVIEFMDMYDQDSWYVRGHLSYEDAIYECREYNVQLYADEEGDEDDEDGNRQVWEKKGRHWERTA